VQRASIEQRLLYVTKTIKKKYTTIRMRKGRKEKADDRLHVCAVRVTKAERDGRGKKGAGKNLYEQAQSEGKDIREKLRERNSQELTIAQSLAPAPRFAASTALSSVSLMRAEVDCGRFRGTIRNGDRATFVSRRALDVGSHTFKNRQRTPPSVRRNSAAYMGKVYSELTSKASRNSSSSSGNRAVTR
jgi:hypothetical protein